jgi:O-6-methylguanine DNA methyltransferase
MFAPSTAVAAGSVDQSVSKETFREVFQNVLGDAVSPSATCMCVQLIDSPVGSLLTGAYDDAVCLLEFIDSSSIEDRLRALRARVAGAIEIRGNDVLEELQNQLAQYFAGTRRTFDVALSYNCGTQFQQRVWSALLNIAYGETWSYLKLATTIGDPGATRAVGMANGMNPIAILIPCHRVVNASGDLGGYGGGIWRKRVLLDLEKGQGNLNL